MRQPRDTRRPENGDKPETPTSDLAALFAYIGFDAVSTAAEEARGREMTGMGRAFRLAAEFVAAILVGLGLGWGIDQLFGTAPWGMVILLLLGFAAGVLNVTRAAAEMNAASALPPDTPAVHDDDDE